VIFPAVSKNSRKDLHKFYTLYIRQYPKLGIGIWKLIFCKIRIMRVRVDKLTQKSVPFEKDHISTSIRIPDDPLCAFIRDRASLPNALFRLSNGSWPRYRHHCRRQAQKEREKVYPAPFFIKWLEVSSSPWFLTG